MGGGGENSTSWPQRIFGRVLNGFPGVWFPTHLGAILQVPWPNYYGLRKLLYHSIEQHLEGAEEVISDDKYVGMGRKNIWVSGTLSKAVVQVVIIFREEMWLMFSHIGRSLVGFHNMVS